MPPVRIKTTQSETSQESIADEDIISDMPSNVIDFILGKLAMRDAIRTSVLSKKWRFYYLNIPELVFDDQFCKELKEFIAMRSNHMFSEVELKYQFDQIVTKSLMLHPDRVERFKVCIPNLDSTMVPEVNKWILYLSCKNVKKLALEYKKDTVCHKLPPYFFSCLDLISLKLQNFVLSPPLEFKGFLNLQQLILIGVDFANNCFESFLSSCPLLERLVLRGCSGVRHFNISGSKLNRLCIKADEKFKSISLGNAPNLTEVSVTLERAVISLEGHIDLYKFMDSLPKVEILHLNGKFLKLLDGSPVSQMLSTSPDSLKILVLKNVKFMDFDQISAVICLIKSAQNLQELHIEASKVKIISKKKISGYLKLLDCKKFLLGKLRLVKFKNLWFRS